MVLGSLSGHRRDRLQGGPERRLHVPRGRAQELVTDPVLDADDVLALLQLVGLVFANSFSAGIRRAEANEVRGRGVHKGSWVE